MVCARVNKIREPQLPDIPESLEHGGIKDGKGSLIELDIPVDRVFDDLQGITKRIFIYMG
jgi:hypothetical protein